MTRREEIRARVKVCDNLSWRDGRDLLAELERVEGLHAVCVQSHERCVDRSYLEQVQEDRDALEDRLAVLEAEAGAMRGALQILDDELERLPADGLEEERRRAGVRQRGWDALAGDAGRALLDRLAAAERTAREWQSAAHEAGRWREAERKRAEEAERERDEARAEVEEKHQYIGEHKDLIQAMLFDLVGEGPDFETTEEILEVIRTLKRERDEWRTLADVRLEECGDVARARDEARAALAIAREALENLRRMLPRPEVSDIAREVAYALRRMGDTNTEGRRT